MRIVHIDRQRSWTGQIKQGLELGQALRGIGHDVAFVANPGSQLGQRASADGFQVLEVQMRGWRAYPSILKIAKFLDQTPTDIIHAHGPRDHFYAVAAAGLSSAKHVVRTKHNHTRLRSGPFSRVLYNKASAIVAISEDVRQRLLADRIAPEHVTTIYDAIQVDGYDPREKDPALLEEHGLAGVDTIVGSLSSLHVRKGVEEILRAYKHLRTLMPDENMKCVLTGGRWEQWVPLVAELGLTDEVVFTGFQTDAPAYLALLDVYVLPSHNEGLGTSILEAMCMERPVVVSDVGGIPESVTPETGILLSDCSPEPLAEAIRSLIVDPERRLAMGRAGRKRVLSTFAAQAQVERIDALYRRLVVD